MQVIIIVGCWLWPMELCGRLMGMMSMRDRDNCLCYFLMFPDLDWHAANVNYVAHEILSDPLIHLAICNRHVFSLPRICSLPGDWPVFPVSFTLSCSSCGPCIVKLPPVFIPWTRCSIRKLWRLPWTFGWTYCQLFYTCWPFPMMWV